MRSLLKILKKISILKTQQRQILGIPDRDCVGEGAVTLSDLFRHQAHSDRHTYIRAKYTESY